MSDITPGGLRGRKYSYSATAPALLYLLHPCSRTKAPQRSIFPIFFEFYENRSLVPRLQAQGINVKFEEARDAHNWENWRDRLRNGLSWLFPGPVWMVYE